MNSLRPSGVRPSHKARISGSERIAVWRSSAASWTVPCKNWSAISSILSRSKPEMKRSKRWTIRRFMGEIEASHRGGDTVSDEILDEAQEEATAKSGGLPNPHLLAYDFFKHMTSLSILT